jgi:hypothetical protein
MAEKKKHKKVNQFNLQQCEAVLNKLKNCTESEYYQHVLQHYNRLRAATK